MARLWLMMALLAAAPSTAAETVFLVRHAEKADKSEDPPLSKAGQARAEKLAAMLRDSGIRAIFVTQYRRNAETAGPLAKLLHLVPQVVPSGEVAALVEKIRAEKGRVLVVGHVDTVPKIVAALGGPSFTLGDPDYDNLFVLVATTLVRLHF